MSRYVSRAPATAEYFNALGQASFSFSSLEWNLVCIARSIDASFITDKFYTKWTSGTVFLEFKKLIETKGSFLGPLQGELVSLADDFDKLVKRRNGIAHAQPITGPDGSAMLSRYQFIDSFYWTIGELDAFTKDCEELSINLNDILHHRIPR